MNRPIWRTGRLARPGTPPGAEPMTRLRSGTDHTYYRAGMTRYRARNDQRPRPTRVLIMTPGGRIEAWTARPVAPLHHICED